MVESLKKMSETEREQLVYSLEGKPEAEAMPWLVLLTEDPSAFVRLEAVRVLYYYPNEQSRVLLIHRLRDDPDPSVRAEAAYSLTANRSEHTLLSLMTALVVDRSPLVRGWVALSIGDYGEPLILPFVLWYMKKVRSRYVRKSLCYAAYKLGHKDSLQTLITYLYDYNYKIRCATANLLSYLIGTLSLVELKHLVLPEIQNCVEREHNPDIIVFLSKVQQSLEAEAERLSV